MGQISAKYFFKLYCQKIFAVSFKSYIQLVIKISFTSFHTVPDWKLNISKEMARKEGLNLFPPCMIGIRKCADIQFKWFSI